MILKKNAKTVIRIVLLVIIAALVGVSVYSINAAALNGNQLPMPFGFGLTVVLSGSMEPAISIGDMLVVLPADHYEVGDVVVYQTQGMSVVHRIISIDGDEIITRGDANSGDDAPIHEKSIKGRVVCAIPLVGYLVCFIKTPIGTLALLGLAILLLEVSFKKDKKKDKGELEALKQELARMKNGEEP